MCEQPAKEPDQLVQLLMPISLVAEIDHMTRFGSVSRAEKIRTLLKLGLEQSSESQTDSKKQETP